MHNITNVHPGSTTQLMTIIYLLFIYFIDIYLFIRKCAQYNKRTCRQYKTTKYR